MTRLRGVKVKQRLPLVFKQLNWRMFWMRLVMYALLLGLVVGLTPGIYFTDSRLIVWFATVLGFGLISAIIKPILQIATLPMLFFTYGLVVIVINVAILMMVNLFFSDALTVEGWIPAIFGGVVLGLVGGLLESLLGLTPPIVPDSEEALRGRVRFQDRGLVYALFQATPADLRKYGPPEKAEFTIPDRHDAQVILAALDAAEARRPATAVAPEPRPTALRGQSDGTSLSPEEFA